MPLENLLTYTLGVIGILLSMLIGLVIFVFLSLKNEVVAIKNNLMEISSNRAKLVHKDECKTASGRIHTRLDEHDAMLHDLGTRTARLETAFEVRGRL